ncbi:hypothetical protein U9M48_018611 [Paspalum notatum var. saurae]|uniref:Uncharacterized protein n=1 Tax=Paspalum notatum var. saurae TaxID=547442 RepID=A0AAQ3WQH0_PASNO
MERKRRWGGSVFGHKTYKRDREGAERLLMQKYFDEEPIFDEDQFRRRFRMRKPLFRRIVDDITAANSFFKQKRNAVGVKGFSPIHKCTAAMRVLAYGHAADLVDDVLLMGESTVLLCVKEFVKTVNLVYEPEFLRPPNQQEVEEMMRSNEARGFPGMIGSIDCMHWEWANCLTGWQGVYKGHKGKPTMILEAVASQDLRIWHAFFGLLGSHIDINVLHRSPVFDDLANGRAPEVEFTVNGNQYTMGYYLADGIYPDWATLVKSISAPASNKQKIYAQRQESCRKNVERTFGVLRAKWKILHSPARLWKARDLNSIVRACIILHNMIIEDEKGADVVLLDNSDWPGVPNPPINHNKDVPAIAQLIDAYNIIKSKETSTLLCNDHVEHIWGLYGSSSGPFARTRGN